MALLGPETKCPLCGERVCDNESSELYATTFWAMQDERFRQLDDAVMHQQCITSWELLPEYIDYFNSLSHKKIAIGKSGRLVYVRKTAFRRAFSWLWESIK